MQKYGFVYIWRDRKHKRYYIGCHWGTEDDGYICSSRWMRNSYKRRPKDFTRKIISRVSDRVDLLDEEYKWLNKISPDELGKRYYNLRNAHSRHWSTDTKKRDSISDKSRVQMNLKWQDPEFRIKMLDVLDKTRNNISAETREKRSRGMIGKNKGKQTVTDGLTTFHTLKDDPRWITGEIWAASKGKPRPPISEDHRIAIQRKGNFRNMNAIKVTCIHCGAIGNKGNISRYHNNNCKLLGEVGTTN